MDDIDIFSEESMFRDPVYEEMGFIFDPERNEYFEMVDDSEHGRIRSYIPPRDVAVQRSIGKSRVGRHAITAQFEIKEIGVDASV